MKARKHLTVEILAELTGHGVDEVLLKLWEHRIEHVVEAKSVVYGNDLLTAKKALGIPVTSKLTSLSYWQTVFSLNEAEMRRLLVDLKIPMSERARKLPTGAIKKLMSELKRKKKIFSSVEVPFQKKEEDVSTQLVKWRTVGKIEEYVFTLTYEEVLIIHEALVIDFLEHHDPINPPGVKDTTLLESAIFRQATSGGNEEKYPTVEMKAAALLHSLIHNHPFHNGNKRTALVSLLVFLEKNSRMLVCSEDELFRFVLTVAQHKIVKGMYLDLPDREVLEIADWIKNNSRIVEFGEKLVSFRKLKPILNRYACGINHSDGGTNIKVTRKIKSKSIFKPDKLLTCNFSVRNEGEQLQLRTIKKIRAELELDEEHGIDSAAFYDETPTGVGDFIIKYRKALTRLAKL